MRQTDVSDRTIHHLTNPDDAVAVGTMLGRAMSPSYVNDIPDPDLRLRYCTILYTANTRWSLDRGTVFAVLTASGDVAGALSLIPYPKAPWAEDDDARYGYDALAQFGKVGGNFAYIEASAHGPLDAIVGPWTYVNVLGVDPPYQGEGIGTALMQHAIADADRARLPMGLITDTERNVRFYTRLGFTTVLEGPESDTLKLWTMIRRAP